MGWGDTYPAKLEGQELNITGIEDGKYLIRSGVNVEGKILESDYTNNFASLYVEIKGNTLIILENY